MKNSSITTTSPNQQPFPFHAKLSATISSAENHEELKHHTNLTKPTTLPSSCQTLGHNLLGRKP
jgi:hypothetical protein